MSCEATCRLSASGTPPLVCYGTWLSLPNEGWMVTTAASLPMVKQARASGHAETHRMQKIASVSTLSEALYVAASSPKRIKPES